jgi:hypothetical protein
MFSGHGALIIEESKLKRGYLLSPLLFIIQVDALQNVIQSFSAHGRLRHSLVPELTFHVIQYADDMLILIQGYINQTRLLK